jgi:hypothetical protein
MQQRQLRLGDILDDYCPRERRVTNHAVVAMVGEDVKQTRCTTCDCEHEFKHARVPRQRKKSETPAALYAQVAATAPKRVTHDVPAGGGLPHDDDASTPAVHVPNGTSDASSSGVPVVPVAAAPAPHAAPASHATPASHGAPASHGTAASPQADEETFDDDADGNRIEEDGPAHRRLIRASLPRPEGQQPPARPIPEFTIRQPGTRPNRFRPRHQRGGQGFHGGNRSNGNFGAPIRGNVRPQGMPRMAKRHGGGGRKRSK